MESDFAGKNGFIWWTGVVEDRNDPIKLGRCKVRCVGWHSNNKQELPTESLPWSIPILPTNNSSVYAPKEGDRVFGFFMDGESGQHPAILGVFPMIPLKEVNTQEGFTDNRNNDSLINSPRKPKQKIYNTDGSGVSIEESEKASNYPLFLDEPTTSRLARNDTDFISNTFIQERKDNRISGVPTVTSSWDEPEIKYGTKYPYNNVMESESGHIFELDDTPGSERVHLAHRSGTFEEIYPDGSKVDKIVKDKYTIIMKDDNVYVMGQCNITVQGDAQVNIQKNGNIKINGNVEVQVGGNYKETVGGSYTIQSGGNMKITAPRIDLN